MPATILLFERRDPSGRERDSQAQPAPLRAPAPPTSRQIAHRWAMLSHLRRHFAGPPSGPTSPARPTGPTRRNLTMT